MNPLPVRVAHLSSYLRDLIQDVRASGKIAKIEGNPVQVAAVALLSGSIAVVKTMLSDIEVLAGNAKDQARVVGPPILAQVAGDVAARGTNWLLDKLSGKRQGR
jgi:hypothetical protein